MKANASVEYSVVVPVYESDRSVVELVSRVVRVFEEDLESTFEILLIDDGSISSATWPLLERLAAEDPRVRAIRLMRNYGKPAAVLCGLRHVRGRWIFTIDDDLQQCPEDFAKLAEHRDHDVVVAGFSERAHPPHIVLASWVKGHFDRSILGLPCKMSPLKLFTAEVARGMLQISTAYPFIPALLAHVTRDFVLVPLSHERSRHGKSRYSIRRRVAQLSNLLISNSSYLLRVFGGVGLLAALMGFGFGGVVMGRKLLGDPVQPGWASIVVLITVFAGLILVALSLIGEYLIRILEGTSRKPAYVIRGSTFARPTQEVEEDP